MGINLKDTYHAAVIEISGKFLGSLEGDTFRALIYDLKEQGKTKVIVDLAQADLLDSTAIGILIASLTSVRRAGGDMRLANMKKRVRNLFLMTRLLGPVFEDYDSLEAALESYKHHPEPIASA
jgi:anti-sigma B factor antagonist